jgi:hypothetical protein
VCRAVDKIICLSAARYVQSSILGHHPRGGGTLSSLIFSDVCNREILSSVYGCVMQLQRVVTNMIGTVIY